jgi:predicted nucleic acid-binding protein
MSDKAFVDTNVLIYAAIRNDPRSERAEQLLAVERVISVQVLNEFVSVARRRYQMPWNALKVALQWIRVLCPNPVPLTIETHNEAVRIAEQYGYKIYDSLILAAALGAGCSTVYSEDLQGGQVIERKLTIRNPFK